MSSIDSKRKNVIHLVRAWQINSFSLWIELKFNSTQVIHSVTFELSWPALHLVNHSFFNIIIDNWTLDNIWGELGLKKNLNLSEWSNEWADRIMNVNTCFVYNCVFYYHIHLVLRQDQIYVSNCCIAVNFDLDFGYLNVRLTLNYFGHC
jgi:hypothetical protein